MKCKSDPNNDGEVTKYEHVRKEHIIRNEEYLSSLGLENKEVVTPCTFSFLCLFHETCISFVWWFRLYMISILIW